MINTYVESDNKTIHQDGVCRLLQAPFLKRFPSGSTVCLRNCLGKLNTSTNAGTTPIIDCAARTALKQLHKVVAPLFAAVHVVGLQVFVVCPHKPTSIVDRSCVEDCILVNHIVESEMRDLEPPIDAARNDQPVRKIQTRLLHFLLQTEDDVLHLGKVQWRGEVGSISWVPSAEGPFWQEEDPQCVTLFSVFFIAVKFRICVLDKVPNLFQMGINGSLNGTLVCSVDSTSARNKFVELPVVFPQP
mmetsp:Transcript_50181/g.96884  ORF Transcript_50181/g.96884 Transcript_50181/m.96884 type:complete len:245 (+) Transcript_50181:831-1565(+)